MNSISAIEAKKLAIEYNTTLSEIYAAIKSCAEQGLYEVSITVSMHEWKFIYDALKGGGYEVQFSEDPKYCDPDFNIRWSR